MISFPISVIVPVYNDPRNLRENLSTLMAASSPELEIIVVDDASTDDTPAVATQMGARVLRLTQNSGAAAARNYGARHARGDILFFVDADVVIAPGAMQRVGKVFAEQPSVAAVFGSYDAKPRAQGMISQYRNLLHHFVHQTGDPEASTFWAGCGAIRRVVFQEVGGFDERRFPRPSIEDIELGYRLRRAGHRILLDKALQGTHLKRWTFRSLIWTDIVCRAIPWSRLILENGDAPEDLNLKWGQRLSVVLVGLASIFLLLAPLHLGMVALAAAALCGVAILNRALYGFFRQQRGLLFAIGCIPLHLLYYLYSGLGYLYAWISVRLLQAFVSVQRKVFSKATFWVIATLLGSLQVWVYRYRLSTDDAIAYLDIGDAYVRGDWHVAINGYWSPLYSWLLGLTLAIVRPPAYWEILVVKIVNLLMYIFALCCFEVFWRELSFFYHRKILNSSSERAFQLPEWACTALGYLLFLWSTLIWTPLSSDTPDLCTAGLIYLASGIVLRLHTRSATWFTFITLGATLGFAYLSKAVMFPLSFVFLAVSAFSVGKRQAALRGTVVALLAFTVVAAPFIAALSVAKGRLTIGDAGKLNFVGFVPGAVEQRQGQDESQGTGTLKHPPRKIFDDPEVVEFATPIGGTYPLWYDPSYWYEGLPLTVNPPRQSKVLATNLFFYYKLFLGHLIVSYLILIFVGGNLWPSGKDLIHNWILLIPAVAGLGVYAIGTNMLVTYPRQPSTRYIAPFIVLLFAGVFSSVRLPHSPKSKRLIVGMVVATVVVLTGQLLGRAWQDLVSGPGRHIEWEVADRLKQLGVQPGEKVAILGAGKYDWARLGRVKIIARVVDAKSFWGADAATRAEVLKTIERTGAKVIVQKQKPRLGPPDSAFLESGWQNIDDTGYYAYFLVTK